MRKSLQITDAVLLTYTRRRRVNLWLFWATKPFYQLLVSGIVFQLNVWNYRTL